MCREAACVTTLENSLRLARRETNQMAALPNWIEKAREHWEGFQPLWYRALIKSRRREKVLHEAAEKMYRELMEPEGAWNSESAPMTVER